VLLFTMVRCYHQPGSKKLIPSSREAEHSMLLSVKLRQQAKAVIPPFALPLLRRLRLAMLPRIEQLKRRVGAPPESLPTSSQARVESTPALVETTRALRGTVANLTRAWMRQQQEIASFSAATEKRLVEIERRFLLQEDIAGRGKRVDDTLRFLLDRVEFVRRELMFEMRYSGGGGNAAARPKAQEPRVLEPEKVTAACASGSLRINLGCGHIAAPGYINVDIRDLPGVDVIAEIGNLPFDPGSVDEIASAHLLEHFPQEELRRRLLPYWRSLLKPGGTFRAVTPDGATMLSGVADGSYSFADFREALFGGQDYEGDFHFNLFTPDSLRQLVKEAGFGAVEVPVHGRRNGQCFEFELVALVPITESKA
jgi:hypothetical protein